MDENTSRNFAQLIGVIAAPPVFSHASRGETFYTFPMEIARLSGATDTVNIIVRDELIRDLELCEAEKLSVTGELRSFNNKSGEGAKLVITVFAKELNLCGGDDMNRRYGRSDYLPCITWGLKAREASEWDVGTVVSLEGRIQSRSYIKIIGGEPVEKTAFEVSVTDISEFT